MFVHCVPPCGFFVAVGRNSEAYCAVLDSAGALRGPSAANAPYTARARSRGASLPPPRLRQLVVLGTTPSYELMLAWETCGSVVPIAGPPLCTVRAASTISRRNAATATSLAPSRSRERSEIGRSEERRVGTE